MLDLPDIIGQDAAVARLSRAVGGARMPHAFLFAGPTGVGRRTTAIALARVLLCENFSPSLSSSLSSSSSAPADARTPRPCGHCEDCRMTDADSHPDLHMVYKELARYHDDAAVRGRVMQALGIEVVRQFLLAPAAGTPSRGRAKVFIVLEADLLSIAAQNAMLKTLEEPPRGVVIILICRHGGQMLPTTVSRCSTVRFGPLGRDFVAARLVEAGIAPAEADFWAAQTDGSLGQALRLAGQGLYEIKCELLDRLASMGPAGEAALGEHLAKLTDKLATEAVAAAKRNDGSNLSKMLASRRAAGAMLELLASACRDAMKLSAEAGSGAKMALIHADQRDAIESLAERFSPSQLARVIEQLSEYERILWRNVNPRTVWDNAAITLATAAPLRL